MRLGPCDCLGLQAIIHDLEKLVTKSRSAINCTKELTKHFRALGVRATRASSSAYHNAGTGTLIIGMVNVSFARLGLKLLMYRIKSRGLEHILDECPYISRRGPIAPPVHQT